MTQSPLIPRRELLRIGAVSVLGSAFAPSAFARTGLTGSGDGSRQRNCVFMHLQGGPSHHDLWDPKPDAVAEIRGPFHSMDSTVPGMRFGELMIQSARVAEHLCVIRSMTHKFTNHIAGTYITLTGSNNQQDRDREAHGDDFPGPGAVLNYLDARSGRRGDAGVPRSVSLPNWLSIPGPSNRMPGQYSGFLGSVYDPFLIEGNPLEKDYRPLALSMPEGVNDGRLNARLSLSRQLDSAARLLEREQAQRYDHLRQSAYELVASGRVRKAIDLSEEPDNVRDFYGRHHPGQCLLLARRLIEAGVQFVAFNEFNQKWDTHGGLEGRYKDIVPPMEQAFAALVSDLHERGLLEDTLVVNTGEFGRTPKMNNGAGRDHWPNVYSTVLAGGGIKGGMIHGASDSKGAEVLSHPVSPADVLATMYHIMGIPATVELRDRVDRPIQLSDGRVLSELLSEP